MKTKKDLVQYVTDYIEYEAIECTDDYDKFGYVMKAALEAFESVHGCKIKIEDVNDDSE